MISRNEIGVVTLVLIQLTTIQTDQLAEPSPLPLPLHGELTSLKEPSRLPLPLPEDVPNPQKSQALIDKCRTSYDAISMLHGELFIFKGPYLWRFGVNGLYSGFPTRITRQWRELPQNLTKVDSVYENKQNQIIFFIGREYYVFKGVDLIPGHPKPLSNLGLPFSIQHIDASFLWGHNNRTYLTSGILYWRLNDSMGQVELDYPRDISIWAGVGYNIDDAFQYSDGKTYFFKGLGYWEFNDDRMRVAHAHRKPSSRKWMQCLQKVDEVNP